MKILLFHLFLTGVFSSQLNAQTATGGIKVTTTMHADDSRTVTQINSQNHTSEALTYDKGDKLKQKIVYALDDKNQPISGMIYDAKGVLLMKATYKRDASSRLLEELDYLPDDKLLRRFVYNYNSQGRLAGIQAFDAHGNPLKRSSEGKTPVTKKLKKRE